MNARCAAALGVAKDSALLVCMQEQRQPDSVMETGIGIQSL